MLVCGARRLVWGIALSLSCSASDSPADSGQTGTPVTDSGAESQGTSGESSSTGASSASAGTQTSSPTGDGDADTGTTGTTSSTTGDGEATSDTGDTSDTSGSTTDTTGTTGSTTDSTSDSTTGPTTGPTTDPTTGDGDGDGDGDEGSTTGGTGMQPPPLDGSACDGYATRYWDCCKRHCGWPSNVAPGTTPVSSCNQQDASHGSNYDVPSACDGPFAEAAYTCQSMNPWALSSTLAYGFAAVPASGDVCGRCYQLDFEGTGHSTVDDPGSEALAGKIMVVQATNVGFDVRGGQFDILTPGGGVGAFDACSYQWGVATSELGATYGGFMTWCQQNVGGSHNNLKQCVRDRCNAVFDSPSLQELNDGCHFYVDWYEVADNPNLRYQEVECPQQIIDASGIDRRPLNDIELCTGGGGCTQEQMDACDCSWTNGGANCGPADESCCWTACCG